MYQSSSESSIEHGNFPSVINLYAAGKKEEESLSDMSEYAATGSSVSSESRYQPISYVENISPGPYITPVPMQISKPQDFFPQDRMGSCGSPASSSSDSDTDSDETCNAEKERRNSTTSTSTNSSEDERLPKGLRSSRIRTSESSYATPNKTGIYHIPTAVADTVNCDINPSVGIRTGPIAYQDPLNAAPSSPSSRTASSSNSGKTVRITGRRVIVNDGVEQVIMGKFPQQCQYMQNRIDCSLARGIAESIGLHSQAADSGISNTSPETQSSTEFYQRKIQDTIFSGKVSHSSSGRFSAPSIGVAGTLIGTKSQQLNPTSSSHYPQSILKLSKNSCSLHEGATDFKNYLCGIISLMYAMMMLVISAMLPIIEVSSPGRFLNSYEGFYIFLYSVGILFLVYIYVYLLRDQTLSKLHLGPLCSRQITALNTPIQGQNMDISTTLGLRSNESADNRFYEMKNVSSPDQDVSLKLCPSEDDVIVRHYTGWAGLMLRLAVLGMGVVSMVRDGLLFGRVLDSRNSSANQPKHCSSSQVAVRCVLSLLFTFIQLYFIFINSKIYLQKFQVIAKLGLMHMIIVNLSALIKTVIKDAVFENIERNILPVPAVTSVFTTLSPTRRLLKQEGLYKPKDHLLNAESLSTSPAPNMTSFLCIGGDLMEGVIQTSDPYVYPFTVQYCILTSALLWITWKNVPAAEFRHDFSRMSSCHESVRTFSRRKRHVLITNGFNKGFFTGLLCIVATIVDLIVFHILTQKPNFKLTAARISYSFEILLLMATTIATIVAFFKTQDLFFQTKPSLLCFIQKLEQFLLLASVFGGVYLFGITNIIIGRLNSNRPAAPFLIMGSLFSIIQASVQAIFISVSLRKVSYKTIHERDKPGREIIAFLLLANAAFWCLHLFEHQKLETASDLHQQVFGQRTWIIIKHMSIPLILLFRLLSSIMLAVIWRQAYRFESA